MAWDHLSERSYFYHASTGEVTWDPPPAFANKPRAEPSRKQGRGASKNKKHQAPLGVTFLAVGHWRTRITVGGRLRYIGTFGTADLATAAYE
mmetsp:Transcript_18006/g.51569  ORF Transcript_18006/g.51569 Transcript_18006/m.51569 type:complete len:92 (-) Transcript_18006:578-853(-)